MEYALLHHSVVVEKPYGPYLNDTKEKSAMTFLHRYRHFVIWGTIAVLMLWRWTVGEIENDLIQLVGSLADWRVPLWIATVVFTISFETASIAINKRVSTRTVLALHFGLQAIAFVVTTTILAVYSVRILSSLTIANFWCMMAMKTHSYVAWYRITNHAVPNSVDFSTARVAFWTSKRGVPQAKLAVSFLEFIAFPSFVYDPYPLRLNRRRWDHAISELLSCAGTVLLLHMWHIHVGSLIIG